MFKVLQKSGVDQIATPILKCLNNSIISDFICQILLAIIQFLKKLYQWMSLAEKNCNPGIGNIV